MEPNDPPSQISIVHALWSGMLTVLTGMGFFTGRRLISELDGKADKEHVNDKFDTLTASVHNVDQKLDRMLLLMAGRKQDER